MKQKIEEKIDALRQKLETPEAARFVHDRLSKIVDLGNIGFVAGQSVASAIIEYLKMDDKITPVYNDVDIYMTNTYQMNDPLFAGSKAGILKGSASNVYNIGSEYLGISAHIFSGCEIIKSTHIGKRNEIILFSEFTGSLGQNTGGHAHQNAENNVHIEQKKIFIQKILDSFDINSTKAGMTLYNQNSLIVDDDFLLFLITMQLEITRMTKPVQAYVRALKKRDELGVFFDKDKYGKLISQYLSLIQALDETIYKDVDMQALRKHLQENVISIHPFANMPSEFYLLPEKKTISSPKYVELCKKYKEEMPYFSFSYANNSQELVFRAKEDIPGDSIVKRFFDAGGDVIAGGDKEAKEALINNIIKIVNGKLPEYFFLYNQKFTKEAIEYEAYVADNLDKDFLFDIPEKIRRNNTKEQRTKAKKIGVASSMCFNVLFLMDEYVLMLEKIKKSTGNAIEKTIDESLSINVDTPMNHKTINTPYHLLMSIVARGATEHHINKYNSLIRKIAKSQHLSFVKTFLEPNTEMKKAVKLLTNIKKEYDKNTDFIGKIESDINNLYTVGGWDRFLENDFVEKFMKEDRIKMERELRPDIPDSNKQFYSPDNRYVATMLTTPKELKQEGDQMNHCVGGYVHSVEHQKSLIFHIEECESKKHRNRLTMELWCPSHQNEYYKIEQMRGFSNKRVDGDMSMVELMMEINNVFPFIPSNVPTKQMVIDILRKHININKIENKSDGIAVPSLLVNQESEERGIHPARAI